MKVLNGKAILGRLYFDLEDALFSEISRLKAAGGLVSAVNVLVGSNLLGLHLGRRLAEKTGGHCNVRFLTFLDLVSLLEQFRYTRGTRALPAFSETVVLEELLSSGEIPSYFGKVREMKGIRDALLETFTDLAEGCCTGGIADDIAKAGDRDGVLCERVRAVLFLYAAYRERLARYGADVHARFREACPLAESGSSSVPLLAYGFYDFNEEQWRLIDAFSKGEGVTLFVPWCDEEPFRFVRNTVTRLEEKGFEVVEAPRSGAESGIRGRRVIMSAPDEEEEVRGIVRRIVELVGETGVRFSDIGIVLTAMDAYWPLLREVLTEAGIPYFVRENLMATGNPAARAAIRLMHLLAGRMHRKELVEFLVSAPLAIHGGGEADFDAVSLWIRKSAEAGMLGDGGWVEENARLIERLERARDTGEGTAEAVQAARIVGGVLAEIEKARLSFEGNAPWHVFAADYAALLRIVLSAASDTEMLCRFIESIAEPGRFSDSVSFRAFIRVCETAVGSLSSRRGRLGGGGVNVLTINQARGLSFRYVFMPGLTEHVLPAVARQDPFLKDSERIDIGRRTGGDVRLSEKAERIDEEALIFRLALDSAEDEIVCSHPRFETGTGKERIPSSFLAFAEGPAPGGIAGESSTRVRLSRHPAERDSRTPVSEAEYDLLGAFAFKDGDGALPVNRFFSRGAKMVRARWGERRFTPYDGVFSSRDALEAVHAMLEERGWSFSPTSLEAYAGCPFAYLLEAVLGVDSLEEPERIITISPLQRGSLVHAILARLYLELRRNELLPLEAGTAGKVHTITDDIIERHLESYPETESVGLPVFWEMEKRIITDSIHVLLDEESGEGGEYVPAFFEKAFGGRRDGILVTFPSGGRTLSFHGRIDRIDTGRGDAFRVVDYKTGRLKGRGQEIAGGMNLQLPVYLLAASVVLGRPVTAGIAVYRRVGTGSGKRELLFDGRLWPEAAAELEKVTAVLTDGIENGLFFAVPSGEGCSYCRMRSACPSGRVRIFDAKARSDERCRGYLSIREGASEEE